ncbi:CTP synthase [Micromonospora cathayae]|uniref:CTP synthase n=1 Tax=Micromonospora cathayae TaxID=3028804 RepID=A0ABY7ZRE1_9ACTN|nr:CTP synthase [Micromonospora sp. HUAS 3]WDZ85068.1 CTP synthase [Micromonospora sp. HUAS 3]
MPPGTATKYVFVTGGVASSLGKGLTASSLGCLLTARGVKVGMQKLDPYLNVDSGTMNPYQHGEVFVTEDGAETDLDIGHYERFLDVELDRTANVTSGQIYSSVIDRERRGRYLGDTVQVIPHITDEIRTRVTNTGDEVRIVEIGGTVGDVESLPFIEAARQIRREVGQENCVFVHVSLVPYISPSGELKTKPTQHSVAALRNLGIQPDVLVCRSARALPESLARKIAFTCDVPVDGVVSAPDAPSIYDLPRLMHTNGLDTFVTRRLGLRTAEPDLRAWERLTGRPGAADRTVEVALVGKYVESPDTYLSVTEALRAAGFAHGVSVDVRRLDADDCRTPDGADRSLAGVHGILVPGGFGIRGIGGKVRAIGHGRIHRIPVLGLCLGLQCMVIEAARSLAGLADANSAEVDPHSPHPVVHTMAAQHDVVAGRRGLGGTMRLGAYPARLRPGSVTAAAYGGLVVSERHRHRYEVNNKYRAVLEDSGLRISGTSPDGELVEFVELPSDVHPFFVGTQGHPEFKSRPTRPHPLFLAFVRAACDRAGLVSALSSPGHVAGSAARLVHDGQVA